MADFAFANRWDIGSSGNYWSDYQTRYPQAQLSSSKGIWDTHYTIDENNIDCYPLVNRAIDLEQTKVITINLGIVLIVVVVSFTIVLIVYPFRVRKN